MRIGITLRVVQADGYIEPRDALSHDWISFLCYFDITPILIPNNLGNLSSFLAEVDIQGLILTGGNDISATTYDNIDLEEKNDASQLRDQNEFLLLDHAKLNNLPVLGVCRGAQIINIYFGGGVKLPQIKASHIARDHKVIFTEHNFASGFGVEHCEVNSFHKFVITDELLAQELAVICKAEDDSIEGFHHKQLSIIGIAWHPERPNSYRELNLKIMRSLFAKI